MDEDDEIPPLVSAADWAQTPPHVRDAFLSLVAMVRELSARVKERRCPACQSRTSALLITMLRLMTNRSVLWSKLPCTLDKESREY
jgi:hypothetical protein